MSAAPQSGLSPGSLAIPITGDLTPFEKALKEAEAKAEASARRTEQKARVQMRLAINQSAQEDYQGGAAQGMVKGQEDAAKAFAKSFEQAEKLAKVLVLVRVAFGALSVGNNIVNFLNSSTQSVELQAKAYLAAADGLKDWIKEIPVVGTSLAALVAAIDPVTESIREQVKELDRLDTAWDEMGKKRFEAGDKILDQVQDFSRRIIEAIGKDTSAGRRLTGDKAKDQELKALDDLRLFELKAQAEIDQFREKNKGAFIGQLGADAQQAAMDALTKLLEAQSLELNNFRATQKNALKRTLEEENDLKVAAAKKTAEEIKAIERDAQISALRSAGKDAEAEYRERLKARDEQIAQDPQNEKRTDAINKAFEAREREIEGKNRIDQQTRLTEVTLESLGKEFKLREFKINQEIDARRKAGKEDLDMLEQERNLRLYAVREEKRERLDAANEQLASLEKQRFMEKQGGAAAVDRRRTVFGPQSQNQKVKVENPDVVKAIEKQTAALKEMQLS